jgi:orotidine-5'-phosphate decarboxylase
VNHRLVVALDVRGEGQAHSLIERLGPLGVTFKVGYEAYYAYGEALLGALSAYACGYALDLKLHDIPRTVQAAVGAVVRPGVQIMTVHALGGEEMLRAAVTSATERSRELDLPAVQIFAVTILTSLDAGDLEALGLRGTPSENVERLAAVAQRAGCSGIVCSPAELRGIKARFGAGFATFCPGVRPAGSAPGDQRRVATPAEAMRDGADYVVVGRPITEAADPVAATRAILDEMRAVPAKA